MKSFRITAPLLTDEEREQATTAGGLSHGEQSSDTIRHMLAGLQTLPTMYPGTANPQKVAKRRARNKTARQSRKANR